MFWEILYYCRFHIILMIACWLFAIATFAQIFLTGKWRILDKRAGDGLYKEYPGLMLATACIMVLSLNVVPIVIVRSVILYFS
jgi:hypothetical protein